MKQTFFKKIEYRFWVKSTWLETGRFYTKWIYHKERSFASNYVNFLKILFQLKDLL